ncbi:MULTISPECIES: hypothetical protein [unclassified Streptomyces]|uniref:hypothetical protein n=1 Tax=unclassified Streptomyces TaxID=2593676 RepID=UPI00324EBA4C
MPEQRNALTELVQASVGAGRRMSTRDFAAVAVDPETNWSPGKSLVGKIIAGQGYNITPQLVSAFAVGLGLPREVVAAAAHLQAIGYTAEELADGAPAVLIRTLDSEAGIGPKARAVAERWDAEA